MANKQLVEWHQSCQNNFKLSIDKERIRLLKDTRRLRDSERKYKAKELQIEKAIRLGKDGFDEEKFMKKERDAILGKGDAE